MRIYLIPERDFGYGLEPDDETAQVLEGALQIGLYKHGLDGTAEWYYDEFVYPTEYGVKLDIHRVPREEALSFANEYAQAALQHCDNVRIEVP